MVLSTFANYRIIVRAMGWRYWGDMDKKTEVNIMHDWYYVSSFWQLIIVASLLLYSILINIWRATMKRPAIVIFLILAEVAACITLYHYPYILVAITALVFSILGALFILWVRDRGNRNGPK